MVNQFPWRRFSSVRGLVAELYYLLWWKNRISSRITEDHYSSSQSDVVGKQPSSHLFCGHSLSRCIQSSISSSSCSDEVIDHNSSTEAIVEHEADLELGIVKMGNGEEGAECEIMRMYNMCGPPRFLFTIKEETRDELVESNDDGDDDDDMKSRTRSMSDAPFLSPLGSPVMKSHNNYHHGYNLNPLFEHFTEVEEEVMNRVRCSPPPKFKFLRDAEEKLVRKLMEEAAAGKC